MRSCTQRLYAHRQQMVVISETDESGTSYLICNPLAPAPNDEGCAGDADLAALWAAAGVLYTALETTRGNLLSMMAASTVPDSYREWLAVVEEALAAARDTESIR